LFVIEPALRKRESPQRHLSLDRDSLIHVKRLCEAIRAELQAREPGYRFAAVGHFMLLILYLSRSYQGRAESPDARKVLELGKALSYLETHFAEPIDIDSLARIAGKSRRSLYRAFEEVVGQSPVAYLQRVRLMKAVEYLEAGDRNVTEVAFDCGFNDSNYFARCFRKVFGKTPSEYRKGARG
jgi:transcriptional regulator GlxA family with amidase domain